MERTQENLDEAMTMLESWECMTGPPMTQNALHGWATSLLEMANNWEEAQWLVDLFRKGAERRPAPIEMRRRFCQNYKPADGIEDDKVDLADFMRGGPKKKGDE